MSSKKKPPESAPVRERPDFSIAPESVKHEYTLMSASLARQGELLAEASRDAATAKAAKEQRYAEVYIALLEDSEGEKKPPEAVLKAKVLTNASYQASVQKYIIADYERSKISSDMEALRTKRDMLVSLGAHIRLELRADPSLRDDNEEGEWEDDEDEE